MKSYENSPLGETMETGSMSESKEDAQMIIMALRSQIEEHGGVDEVSSVDDILSKLDTGEYAPDVAIDEVHKILDSKLSE